MAVYFLDNDQQLIKIVPDNGAISILQTQELPEDNSLLKDTLSVRLKNDERLFDAQYMAIKSYDGNRNSFDMYRIVSESVPDNATEFEGVQVAPYELEGVVVEDLRPQGWTIERTTNQILKDSDWRLGYVDDNLPTVTTNFYYLSAKDSLKKLQELTGVEFTFKVEISGNKITDKWVEVYKELGNRTLKRFNYGTNALTVKRETNHSELYTALIGRGKGEEVGETEAGDATYGRKINFADVEWKKSAGKPVDKPKGQKYIELPQATAEFGVKMLDGRKVPRIGLVEFSDTEDPEVLIEQTWQALQEYARPKVLFSATVANIGDTGIGDTVTIHRHDLNMHYKTRVRKVMRNRKNNDKTQVEIGDVVYTASTKRQANINSQLDNMQNDLSNVKGEVSHVVTSADGKNNITYSNIEPERKKVGDSWVRDHPSLAGETQWLVWNGEAWELILDTSETTLNKEAIDQAQQDIAEVKQTADEAVEQIDTAVANAGFTSLDETISSVQSISNQAQINAGTAIDNALEAMTQASLAVENTGSLNVRVDDVENTLSIKADKQIVDDLTGVVDLQALDIKANADGLRLKANQDTVDLIDGRVSSLGTEVSAVAGQISNKVWKTDIETAIDGIEVGGRNLVLDSEGMYSGTNTSMNHYFELSPYATTNRIINATAITLDFDVITEDFTEGTIVLELQVIDENGTLRFIQNNATTLSRPQANHRVSRTIFLNDLNYEINELHRVVMYARKFTGSVSIGNPKVSFSTIKSDWTPAPEDTDAKISHIETEFTQKYDSITQSVSSLDGRVTVARQDLDSITNTVTDHTGKIANQQLTINGLQTEVFDPETGLTSVNTQLANLVNVAVTGDELSGALSVLEDNLNLRLVAKDEIITQINLSEENILLQANKIQALGDVVVDGKLTITDEFIAPNAQIDGAKIADATIGSAKIASLDASKISTGTLDGIAITGVTITGSTFIQESSLAGSTYGRWDRRGITLRDATGSMIMDMNREGINFHGSSTETAGTYINNNLIDVQNANIYDLNVTGTNARLLSASFTGNIHVGNSSTGTGRGVRFTGQTIPTPLDRMLWVGYGYAGDGVYHYVNNGWRKLQNELTSASDVTVNQLTVSNIVDASSLQLRNRLRLQNTGLQFTGSTLPEPVDRQMWIGYGYADNGIYVSMGGIWHKHGATISDERLKENIVDTRVDSLSAITSWNFVEFEWKNLEYGRGRQFGLIAQNTSHIANYYDEVDRWEIDSGKQTMMNSHAIQQLALREQNTNKVASQALQATETNAQRIECLERRIEELEGVA